ncbi:myelin-oligodendrocyte glycoprotein-like [Dromiciops gliroides]|uniref:myelin-oligodendrocyte glycoprotein-like n=1 Tax=Dromiciops gliroides TaxID=33562 RepID=UPI001CC43B94|nr:myelin-oligodendrocyte glycoprotein-like [Dromiciops gliroides]XP_043832056.1 myelin-oligodendrocyte glycoprotein-like [Dromiciops gliroides]
MEIFSPLVCFLSSYFITFILLFRMPTLTSGQFSVIGPAEPIQASLGGEAELTCYLSPPQSAQHMEVIWFQSTRMVHLYQDGQDKFEDQDPDYQGRTELVRDAITSGNVTLKIRDVKYLDAGWYKCLIEDDFHQEEADMELKVLSEESEPKISTTYLWIFLFLVSLILLLLILMQVCFSRSVPWMKYINRSLILIYTLEFEMIICVIWIQQRCVGFLYKESALENPVVWGVYFLLLLINLCATFLQRKMLPQHSYHHRIQAISRT